jgi:hypothetical protein
MKRSFLFVLLLWPHSGMLGAPQNKGSQKPVAAAKKVKTPAAGISLDRLVTRVNRYWALISHGNRLQAESFVYPSDRKRYEASPVQQFRDPRLKSLELSDDPSEVRVTMVAKCTVTSLAVEMECPVKEQWKFEKGTWYRRFEVAQLPMVENAKTSNPIELEVLRQIIRSKLHFEKTDIDIGSPNQGTIVTVALKYTLTDTDPIPVTLKYGGPTEGCSECGSDKGIGFVGAKDEQFLPGKGHELTIEIPTWNYDGAVKDQFTLIAKTKDIEVSFPFLVHGNVYTPISATPKTMQFKKGEREKELLLRNNSRKEIRLVQFISESRTITIEPFPIVLAPGQEVRVTVKASELMDKAFPGAMDRITITYTPVDGFSVLAYRVFLNVPEEKLPAPAR